MTVETATLFIKVVAVLLGINHGGPGPVPIIDPVPGPGPIVDPLPGPDPIVIPVYPSPPSAPISWEFIGQWSPWHKESNSRFSCPNDQIMVARAHSGDENGNTQYWCGTAVFNDRVARVNPGTWSPNQRESRSSYFCPSDQVMLGREHDGDENGNTRYLCGTLTWAGQLVGIETGTTLPSQRESNSRLDCEYGVPTWQVMIGRTHSGDENGQTTVTCGILLNPGE